MYKNLKSSRNKVSPFRPHCHEDDEPWWVRTAKGTLFCVNVLLWFAVCAIIALGVFGIVYSHSMDMTDGKFVLIISGLLVGLGSLGFLICLMGCFGAMIHNRPLLITFKCCGVKSYEDWSENNAFKSNTKKIPKSCCYKPVQQDCESASDKESFYSKETDGCLESIFNYLEERGPIVIIALSIVILLSITNVILGSIIAAHV
ncbi:hypothetical protein Avbf_15893 [Armadillidium vulgare]|nr:hypothetical protein Avbf_15893 [Armadillidium vulgare]